MLAGSAGYNVHLIVQRDHARDVARQVVDNLTPRLSAALKEASDANQH